MRLLQTIGMLLCVAGLVGACGDDPPAAEAPADGETSGGDWMGPPAETGAVSEGEASEEANEASEEADEDTGEEQTADEDDSAEEQDGMDDEALDEEE